MIGPRFPYIPFSLTIRDRAEEVEALLDTGFDGDIVVPEASTAELGTPDEYGRFRMADGALRRTDVYYGTVQLDALGTFPARGVVLGTEYLLGRGLSDRFSMTLDHGRRIIFEP